MKKTLFVISSFIVFTLSAPAQKLSTSDLKLLYQREDTLQALAKNLIVDTFTAGRMRNDSLFIKTLVRTLQIKNSFHFPFDSVQGISKLYAPDSTFRIFSWSLSFDDFYSRQRAAIQFKTPDGSLKLVPLRDFSEFTGAPTDSVRTKDNWIGAVYYNIIKTVYNGKAYYTLFGIDDNSVRSTKKWIEVLTFTDKQQPVFGGPYFSFQKDSIKRSTQYRYFIEYKKEASALVNYEPDLNMVLVDHLISETDEPDKPYTFIPDGDNEAFTWQNGKWMHIDKPFTYKLQDGQAPIPDPVRDDQGNNNEEKLKQQSDKNKAKKKGGG